MSSSFVEAGSNSTIRQRLQSQDLLVSALGNSKTPLSDAWHLCYLLFFYSLARYAPFTNKKREGPEPDLGTLPASMASKCPKCRGISADCDLCTCVIKLLMILRIGGVVITDDKSIQVHGDLIKHLLSVVHNRYAQLDHKRKNPAAADLEDVLAVPPECFVPQTYTPGDERLQHATQQMTDRILSVQTSLAKETEVLKQQVARLSNQVAKRKRPSAAASSSSFSPPSVSAAAAAATASLASDPAVQKRVTDMLKLCAFNLNLTKLSVGEAGWKCKSQLDTIRQKMAQGNNNVATRAELYRLIFESEDFKKLSASESANSRLIFGDALNLFRTVEGESWTVHFHGKYSAMELREACNIGHLLQFAPNFLYLCKFGVSYKEMSACVELIMLELQKAAKENSESFKRNWILSLEQTPYVFSYGPVKPPAASL